MIFPEQKLAWFFPKYRRLYRLCKQPLYDSAPLAETIASMVGKTTTFNDLQRRVMIPAVNLSTGEPQFLRLRIIQNSLVMAASLFWMLQWRPQLRRLTSPPLL